MKKFRARRSNPDGSLTNIMRREEIAFATATRDALLALGARQVYPASENGPGCLVVSMGEYEIDTKAGLLRVTAGGRDICTRFVYPQNGNGKWNFHKILVGISYDQPDPERKLLALFLENLRPLLKGLPESGDLPWDDCKVAFSVDDGYEIWEKFQGEYWALELPTGWKPIEMDASGARCVMVFRVGGMVSNEDGIRVRGLLDRMDLLSRAEPRL